MAGICFADINVSAVPYRVKQGSVVIVKAHDGVTPESVSLNFLGRELPMYKDNGKFGILLGVPASAPVGLSTIEVIAAYPDGSVVKKQENVIIKRSGFIHEKLAFTAPTKKSKLSKDSIAHDQDELSKVLTVYTAEKAYNGRFIRPLKGYVTSPFGAIRLYNGKKIGDHRGADIGGNPSGTPIKASNSGKVVFSKLLNSLGAVAVIDHGQGVHSIYMHMSRILKKEGSFIKKGEVIGLVGNTGISTAPHLHWGMSVHDTRVDPFWFLKSEM